MTPLKVKKKRPFLLRRTIPTYIDLSTKLMTSTNITIHPPETWYELESQIKTSKWPMKI
jgi:hypothetical protein